MTDLRAAKVESVAEFIGEQVVDLAQNVLEFERLAQLLDFSRADLTSALGTTWRSASDQVMGGVSVATLESYLSPSTIPVGRSGEPMPHWG